MVEIRLWIAATVALCFSQVLLQAWAQLSEPTAYDQLELHGFPRGLLPSTVVGYDLQINGRFAVYLKGKCTFTIPGEKLPISYSSTITGVLQYGKLMNLEGVQVKVYFVWLPITGIEVRADDLQFEVGFISARYPISNFDEALQCDIKSTRPFIM